LRIDDIFGQSVKELVRFTFCALREVPGNGLKAKRHEVLLAFIGRWEIIEHH
jgi:hypothetical protein